MPVVLALLLRGLVWLVTTYAGQWVLKTFIALGIGVVTTKLVLPDLLAFVESHTSGMTPFLFQMFGACGFDVAITMVLSALVASATGKMALKAVQR